MILELPESLEAALKSQANARGVSPAGYVREVLRRDLKVSDPPELTVKPFQTGRGILAKYGQAPSSEEIEANREEMFYGFGQDQK